MIVCARSKGQGTGSLRMGGAFVDVAYFVEVPRLEGIALSVVESAGGNDMDNAILKKRLSTFKTEGGSVTKVSDDLLVDILRAWEQWGGTAKDFYETLGLSKNQLGGLMNKAKKICREGNIVLGDFKEVKLESIVGSGTPCGIEVAWEQGRVIRFSQVDQLVDFLKKAA